EVATFLEHVLAGVRLVGVDDSRDALHVADDVDAHADSVSRMETGLRGKRVLVTGASGGIGSACARAFAAEGAQVVVHYHRGRDRAEALADELARALLAGADLTDEVEVDELFAAAGPRRGCAAGAGGGPAGGGA